MKKCVCTYEKANSVSYKDTDIDWRLLFSVFYSLKTYILFQRDAIKEKSLLWLQNIFILENPEDKGKEN